MSIARKIKRKQQKKKQQANKEKTFNYAQNKKYRIKLEDGKLPKLTPIEQVIDENIQKIIGGINKC